MNMRHRARLCLERAKSLLASIDNASVVYCCLELRFAIEYVVYGQLQSYLEETQNDAIKKWIPKDVIQEMKSVDPGADKSRSFAYGIEDEPGVEAKEMIFMGEDSRFSIEWASAAYNALGNFLHTPTLYQLEKGQFASTAKMRKKAGEIIVILEHTLSSPVYHFNMGVFYELTCECGKQIKRRRGSFSNIDGIKCPKCEAIYDITHESESNITYQKRRMFYSCPVCGVRNGIGVNEMKPNNSISCSCGSVFTIEYCLSGGVTLYEVEYNI